jgi:hypothetical protein
MCDVDWDDLRFFLAISEQRIDFWSGKILERKLFDCAAPPREPGKETGARLFDRLPDGYEMTARSKIVSARIRLR